LLGPPNGPPKNPPEYGASLRPRTPPPLCCCGPQAFRGPKGFSPARPTPLRLLGLAPVRAGRSARSGRLAPPLSPGLPGRVPGPSLIGGFPGGWGSRPLPTPLLPLPGRSGLSGLSGLPGRLGGRSTTSSSSSGTGGAATKPPRGLKGKFTSDRVPTWSRSLRGPTAQRQTGLSPTRKMRQFWYRSGLATAGTHCSPRSCALAEVEETSIRPKSSQCDLMRPRHSPPKTQKLCVGPPDRRGHTTCHPCPST
jgi:hypothetical protein